MDHKMRHGHEQRKKNNSINTLIPIISKTSHTDIYMYSKTNFDAQYH